MNFDDTPQEADFRAEVRAWLKTHAVRRMSREDRFGAGLDHDAYIAAAKAYQAQKAAAGYAAITWPKERGGLGGTPAMQVVYAQEEANFLVPGLVFEVSLGAALPTVAMWGTDAQKAKHIGPALSGDHIWAQMFSEPAAGSDLGNIRMRAERDGEDWVVTGQKVWTSGAHSAIGRVIISFLKFPWIAFHDYRLPAWKRCPAAFSYSSNRFKSPTHLRR